jgi:hypothetical protein
MGRCLQGVSAFLFQKGLGKSRFSTRVCLVWRKGHFLLGLTLQVRRLDPLRLIHAAGKVYQLIQIVSHC